MHRSALLHMQPKNCDVFFGVGPNYAACAPISISNTEKESLKELTSCPNPTTLAAGRKITSEM